MTVPERTQRTAGRRAQVLRVLREADEPLGTAKIAERLGIHVNTVRFHLDTLVDNGQVQRTRAASGAPGRPPQLFRAVRGMDPMGPRDYRVLAEALVATVATGPDPRRRGLEAGRHWGHRQASTGTGTASRDGSAETGESVDLLIGMLDDLGFSPEQTAGGDRSQIALRNCPFLELAVDRSEVVCPVHLGLMRGALESWQSPVTVDRLEAFVEPDLCLAHLATTGAP